MARFCHRLARAVVADQGRWTYALRFMARPGFQGAASLPLLAWMLVPVGGLLPWLSSSDPGFGGFHLPKELWLATMAAVLWLASPSPPRLDGVCQAAFAVAAAATLSSLTSEAGVLVLRQAALVWVGVSLLLGARRWADDDGRAAVEAALLVAIGAVAVLALLEAQGAFPSWSKHGRAPGATLGQRNTVGHVCALGLPVALGWATGPNRRRRATGVMLGAVMVAAVVVTRCRAAWLATGVGVAVLSLCGRTLRPLALAGAFAALALVVPTRLSWRSPTPYADTARSLFDGRNGSGAGRVVQARASVALLTERPLVGSGPGAWASVYLRVSPPGDPTVSRSSLMPVNRLVTSDALAVLVEQGLVGTAAALALVGQLARTLWRRKEHAALAVLAVLLALSLFDAVLGLPSGLAAAAVALGVASGRSSGGPPFPAALRLAVAAVLCIAVGLSGLRMAAFLVAHHANATWADQERALRLSPDDIEARLALAESYVLEARCAEARPHLAWLNRHVGVWPRVIEWRAACMD